MIKLKKFSNPAVKVNAERGANVAGFVLQFIKSPDDTAELKIIYQCSDKDRDKVDKRLDAAISDHKLSYAEYKKLFFTL